MHDKNLFDNFEVKFVCPACFLPFIFGIYYFINTLLSNI